MNTILPHPDARLKFFSAEKRAEFARKSAAFKARRLANQKAWGIESDEHSSIRTRAEQAEVEEQVIPQAPVVHRQVVEDAPVYDNSECLACQ